MRILITGASGSGTTTLGKAIASKLQWGFVNADDYFWLPTNPPYEKSREHDVRLKMILVELNHYESSVVSGSIVNWGTDLENSFDLIVFLYLAASIRVKRLELREIQKLGYANPEFLQWASEYDAGPATGRSLAKHQQWLSERKCRILKIAGDLTVEKRCELVLDSLHNKV